MKIRKLEDMIGSKVKIHTIGRQQGTGTFISFDKDIMLMKEEKNYVFFQRRNVDFIELISDKDSHVKERKRK